MQRSPQVDHVTALPALRVEALPDMGVQVDAEGASPSIGPMNRTGTAALRSRTAQARRQAQAVVINFRVALPEWVD